MEENLQFQEDAPYRGYIRQLESHKSDADRLAEQVSAGLSHLTTLEQQHEFVSTRSNSLHEACQHLLQEQEDLARLSERIAERLVFFTEADRIGQKLTGSTLALSANSDTFFQMLDRIDECMIYVLQHVRFSIDYGIIIVCVNKYTDYFFSRHINRQASTGSNTRPVSLGRWA